MFDKLRGPSGNGSLLLIAIAFLALAGMLLGTPLPRDTVLSLAAFAALCGIGFGATWWKQQRDSRYDLNRLWDSPPVDRHAPEEPYEDTAHDEASPYCGYCNEVYAPGTYRCENCGREL